MKNLLFVFFIFLLTIVKGSYNPIPVGTVIISTLTKIFVMRPIEYGGDDKLNTIFTASANMTIINTIYDSTAKNLFILFINQTNGSVYLCQLISREQLDTTVFQLPFTFSSEYTNNFTSITSDVGNRRGFLTFQANNISIFSMAGLMSMPISVPETIPRPIRSVNYATSLNRLFIITDSTIDSCSNLDTNQLHCCEGPPRSFQLRSIVLDETSGDLIVYVLDYTSGIYLVRLNSSGCPISVNPVNTLGQYTSLQFASDGSLYFASGSMSNETSNSFLLIANGTGIARAVSIGLAIVALHISYPSTTVVSSGQTTCFNGITYSDYRVAVILAAIFGTIMGIFMCFNALFCIDFFMTKSIIRGLKKQIPYNLLEDQWNKLIEEKYAKIALEKHLQNENPAPKRKSSIFGRKSSVAIIPVTTSTANSFTREHPIDKDSKHLSAGRPKISTFLRRKSDNYFSRRQSDDYENKIDSLRNDFGSTQSKQSRIMTNQNYIEPVVEEVQLEGRVKRNLSGQTLIKFDENFL